MFLRFFRLGSGEALRLRHQPSWQLPRACAGSEHIRQQVNSPDLSASGGTLTLNAGGEVADAISLTTSTGFRPQRFSGFSICGTREYQFRGNDLVYAVHGRM